MQESTLALSLLLSGAVCLFLISLWIYSRSTPAMIARQLGEVDAAAGEALKLCKAFRDESLAREAAQIRFEEEVHNLLEEARNNSRRAAQHKNRTEKLSGVLPAGEERPLTGEEQRVEYERRLPSI